MTMLWLLIILDMYVIVVFFFFSSRRRHTIFDCDWSSDVCSSDLSEMNAIRTIARRELKALFDQPTAYLLLVVFTGLNAYLFWPQVEVYHTASLRPMLDLLPWLLLVLVSAVTMRALAEDTRAGTLEVVLAQPVTELELLVGKYAGQVLFLLIALALTLTIPLGLALGAKLEVGVLIAQYLGAALLTAGLAAVGVWASSVTRNQITAFIVAAAVIFALIFVGYDPLVVGLPPRLGAIAASLGVLSHFSGIADRKSTRLNSSHSQISYAVFCLKKKNTTRVDLLLVVDPLLTLIESGVCVLFPTTSLAIVQYVGVNLRYALRARSTTLDLGPTDT